MASEKAKPTLEKENIYNLNSTPFNTTSRRGNIDVQTGDGEQLDSQDSTKISTSIYDNVLQIPNWTIRDFVNERTKFLRQGLDGSGNSAYNDRGSFFYKVFFNFSSNFGLFGSLLKRNNGMYLRDENTAYAYLQNNIDGGKFTPYYKSVLKGKQKSLESFGKILNYLTMECPWFFKEIGGLSSVTKRNFNEITNEKKQITISFNPDAVDMRVSTLLDLYVNACYDTINFKEVIPENLRKFDMAIILFNPPIANLNMEYNYLKRTSGPKFILDDEDSESFDTGYDSENEDENKETVYSKNENNWAGLKGDQMSYKCIILKNCEISLEDLITTPESLSTEEPSNLEFTITINYLRSYIYNINNILNIETLDNLYNDDEFNQNEFNSSFYNTEDKVTILQKTGIVRNQNSSNPDSNPNEEPDWDNPDYPYDPDDPDSNPDSNPDEEPDWDNPDNPYDPDNPDGEYDEDYDDEYDEEIDYEEDIYYGDYPYSPDDPEYDPEEDPNNPLYNPERYPDYEYDEDIEEEPGYNPDKEPDWDNPDNPYDPDDPNSNPDSNPDNPSDEPDWDNPDNPYDPDNPDSEYDPDNPDGEYNPDDDYDDEYYPDDDYIESDPWWVGNFEEISNGVYTDGTGNYYIDNDGDGILDENINDPNYVESESPKDTQIDDEIIDDEYTDDYEDDYDWANEEDITEENKEEIKETEKLLYFVGESQSENNARDRINAQLRETLMKYPGWIYFKENVKKEYNPETKVYRITEWYRFKKM